MDPRPPISLPAMPEADLDSIVQAVGDRWTQLRDADVLITGGTGFFGVWLVSGLLHANRRLGLNLRVHVASRRPEQLFERVPEWRGDRGLRLIAADIRALRSDELGRITHLIHAATAASAKLNESDPVEMAHVAAEGTRHMLGLAHELGVERTLFTSSGAVYGNPGPGVTHVSEAQMGTLDPLNLRNAYGEGKRLAELYCAAYAERYRLPVTIARCFAFVGPHLPLDIHFAIGNFIRDALMRRPIIVKSDGTPRRSYLYSADLASWLLTILLTGVPARAYNVGSERDISVGELACLIGELADVPVEIQGTPDPAKPVERYVPATGRIRAELGAVEGVDLKSAILRTMSFYRAAS